MKRKSQYTAALFLIGTLSRLCAGPVDLQMGSRGFGMGGAFAAVADDASAVYWNPAGLTQLRSITLSETNWLFQDINNLDVNYVSGVVPIENVGTVAGAWLMKYATLSEGYGDTQVDNKWYEQNFTLAGGRELWKSLGFFKHTSVGVALNRFTVSGGDVNGAGTGIDVGFLTRFPRGFRLALVGRNLGADVMGDKIDPEYRLGLAWQWMNPKNKIVVAADASTKSGVEYTDGSDGVGTNYKAYVGAEYTFRDHEWAFSARTGANNTLLNSRDGIVYSFGVGGSYSGISAQYAFQTDSRDDISLGPTHRFTVEVPFEAFKHGVAAAPESAGGDED